MKLSYVENNLTIDCDTKDNELLKRAGFNYCRSSRKWVTPFSSNAVKLSRYLSEADKSLLTLALRNEENTKSKSNATTTSFSLPAPVGLEYLPFQKAGIEFMLEHKRVLLADEMGCLSGDTLISVQRNRGTRKYKLKDAYLRFNTLCDNKKLNWDRGTKSYCRALKEERFGPQQIDKILFKGAKKVIKITTGTGKYLKLTPDHEVLKIGLNWIAAGELSIGDKIITNGIEASERIGNDGYTYLIGPYFKGHKRYSTSGLLKHVWLIEQLLGREIEDKEEIHHINGIRSDNRFQNLKILSRSEHKKCHKTENHFKNFTRKNGTVINTLPTIDEVVRIDEVGIEDVYDIVMKDPHRNFVANGIVVHNCGKTIQAIGLINYFLSSNLTPPNCLIVCPASLRRNWANELVKWLISPLSIEIVSKSWPTTNVVIINYDILNKYSLQLNAKTWDFLILDEAHYLKNSKAKRTKEVLG